MCVFELFLLLAWFLAVLWEYQELFVEAFRPTGSAVREKKSKNTIKHNMNKTYLICWHSNLRKMAQIFMQNILTSLNVNHICAPGVPM